MKVLLMVAAVMLLATDVFAATQSIVIYGGSPAEVQQKVHGFVGRVRAGQLPMQMRGSRKCTDPNRRDFGRGKIRPFQRRVYSVQFNNNTYVATRDGSFRPSHSATVKVFCGRR